MVSQAQAENEDNRLSFVPRAGITDEGPQAEVGAGVSAAAHFARQAAEAPRDLGRLARAPDDRVELVHRVEGAVGPKPTFQRAGCLSGWAGEALQTGSWLCWLQAVSVCSLSSGSDGNWLAVGVFSKLAWAACVTGWSLKALAWTWSAAAM